MVRHAEVELCNYWVERRPSARPSIQLAYYLSAIDDAHVLYEYVRRVTAGCRLQQRPSYVRVRPSVPTLELGERTDGRGLDGRGRKEGGKHLFNLAQATPSRQATRPA